MDLRKQLQGKDLLYTSLLGLVIITTIWYGIYFSGLIPPSLWPAPHTILLSFGELYLNQGLVENVLYSVKLNVLGYLLAVATLPIGFVLGLFGTLRGLFSKYIDALRYVPLTACTGIFIVWAGIDDTMKVTFLAAGIIVYLLPTVVQRIDEIPQVYQDTVYTLGANRWQIIRTVYIPQVSARIFDDLRVLTAISWTYLIVAELVNAGAGGLGALSYKAARQSRVDEVFAILILIVGIGIVQDRVFRYIDRTLFPHKYASR